MRAAIAFAICLPYNEWTMTRDDSPPEHFDLKPGPSTSNYHESVKNLIAHSGNETGMHASTSVVPWLSGRALLIYYRIMPKVNRRLYKSYMASLKESVGRSDVTAGRDITTCHISGSSECGLNSIHIVLLSPSHCLGQKKERGGGTYGTDTICHMSNGIESELCP